MQPMEVNSRLAFPSHEEQAVAAPPRKELLPRTESKETGETGERSPAPLGAEDGQDLNGALLNANPSKRAAEEASGARGDVASKRRKVGSGVGSSSFSATGTFAIARGGGPGPTAVPAAGASGAAPESVVKEDGVTLAPASTISGIGSSAPKSHNGPPAAPPPPTHNHLSSPTLPSVVSSAAAAASLETSVGAGATLRAGGSSGAGVTVARGVATGVKRKEPKAKRGPLSPSVPSRRSKREGAGRRQRQEDPLTKEEKELLSQALRNSTVHQKLQVDMSSVPEAPVFRPTLQEFSNPLVYLNKIRAEAQRHGICKIIPPAGWCPSRFANPEKGEGKANGWPGLSAFDRENLKFHTKRQSIDKLGEGRPYGEGMFYTMPQYEVGVFQDAP